MLGPGDKIRHNPFGSFTGGLCGSIIHCFAIIGFQKRNAVVILG